MDSLEIDSIFDENIEFYKSISCSIIIDEERERLISDTLERKKTMSKII
jgi:hypothetical protein